MKAKIDWVVESEVMVAPYIAWLSKGQMMWGNGTHWKGAPPEIQAGLFKHAGIRRPSRQVLAEQFKIYGYCMPWPVPAFPPMLGRVMRPDYVNQWVFGRKYTHLRFFWGLGYIDKNGKIKKEYGRGVAGYFIFLADPQFRPIQQQWLETQPEGLRKQWSLNSRTYIDAVDYQIKASQNKMTISQRLLSMEEYKQLDPKIETENND